MRLDEEEIPSEYLLAKPLCADLVQEAFKTSSYSIMHLTDKSNLNKLQNLLFFNIKDGVRTLNMSNEVSRNYIVPKIVWFNTGVKYLLHNIKLHLSHVFSVKKKLIFCRTFFESLSSDYGIYRFINFAVETVNQR